MEELGVTIMMLNTLSAVISAIVDYLCVIVIMYEDDNNSNKCSK